MEFFRASLRLRGLPDVRAAVLDDLGSSSVFRSRSGTSRRSLSRRIIALAGLERPVSTKLRWRAETSASVARSSWLSRRR
jgi:hypothetical protein